ncbi:MAG: hypothetical protein DRP51_11000, partial [Candidatus Zixiibacteriota bacterium]
LIEDLKNNQDAGYKIAFCHKPFWERSIVDAIPDKLHNLFQTYSVDAMFSGHYHSYFSGKYDNIIYTNVGSSGGGIDGPGPTGLEYHFVWVTVDDKEISIAPIKMGAVLPWDEVTADENNFVFSAQSDMISFPKSFLVNDKGLNGDSDFEVTISNLHPEIALKDSISWNSPDGWTIEPPVMPIEIGSGASETFIFNVNYAKSLYPLPELSINFPYAIDKNASTKKQLPAARQTSCLKIGKKPKIDGDISEDFWKSSTTSLYDYSGEITKTDSVRFYFAYDKKNLYLASYCADSKINSMTTEITEFDGAVYGDDCVGFILQPNRASENMYLIYTNANGIIFDQSIAYNVAGYYDNDESWNSDIEVKTKIGKDYWSFEIRLPLSQFGEIDKDNIWGLNMRRKQPRLDDAAHWQIPWRYGPDFLGQLIME